MSESNGNRINVSMNVSEQAIQRLIYLAHQDLCRVEGSIVLAQEKLDSGERLPGNVRKKAVETVKAGPEQADVLEEAIDGLRSALRAARRAGTGGG